MGYDDALEVRGDIIRTVLCCIVYWSCGQSLAHLDGQLLQFSGLRFAHWARSLCLDSFVFMSVLFCVILSYCIYVVTRWDGSGWIYAFLQCFETVGWVIWPIKSRPVYDLKCVWCEVKPYSIQSVESNIVSLTMFEIFDIKYSLHRSNAED